MSSRIADPRHLVYLAEARVTSVIPQLRVIAPAEACGVTVRSFTSKSPDLVPHDELRADNSSLLVVQRSVYRQYQRYRQLTQVAAHQGIPIVYDLDDLLLKVADEHPDQRQYERLIVSTLEATLHADVITVSSEPLRDALRSLHPHIEVVPNRLPTRIWDVLRGDRPRRSPTDRHAVRIGYFGTRTHYPDLHMIAPALQSVLIAHPEAAFVCYGCEPPPQVAQLPNTTVVDPTRSERNDYLAYAAAISRLGLDIGIAPLIDSEFNRCKSLIKMLEYGALGVPAVYSRMEPYARGVEDGVSGLLAGNLEEWRTALERLIREPDRRLAMGMAARRRVQQEWLLPSGADKWRAAWQLAVDVARKSPRPFQCAPASDLIAMMRQAMAYQQRTVERHSLKRHVARLTSRVLRFFRLRSKRAA